MTKMWGVKAYRRYILWEKSKDSRKHGSHRKHRLARNYRVLGSGARCTGAAVEIPVSVVSNGADKYNGAVDKSESRCSILTALGFSWLLFTPLSIAIHFCHSMHLQRQRRSADFNFTWQRLLRLHWPLRWHFHHELVGPPSFLFFPLLHPVTLRFAIKPARRSVQCFILCRKSGARCDRCVAAASYLMTSFDEANHSVQAGRKTRSYSWVILQR